ncbi:MAG: hypothetical protein PWR10_1541 [Halanaerobiales bacterium]|nr:hypothetical protein [Halanaerobiales bacterium]
MATKKTSNSSNKKSAEKKEPLYTIEKLARKNDIPDWILAGVKQRNRWGEGKKITEKEFLAKAKEFEKGPMKK